MVLRAVCLGVVLVVAGCVTTKPETNHVLHVPCVSTTIEVDGELNETCYREHPPLTAFVVAGKKALQAEPTQAWLFWRKDALICAFACVDSTPAWVPPSANERDVDGQDRCELFLWTGDEKDAYYCIELAPANALHDYRARFYRQFDDAWTPGQGAMCRATLTPAGYSVEMVFPKAAVEAMGLPLNAGTAFRAGLFRADYDKYSGAPTWITWIDRGNASADFHVAESFGKVVLNKR